MSTKKTSIFLRDKHGEIDEEAREKLAKELGDVLWYVAQLCTELGLSMEEVAKQNLEKLFSRKKRGVLHGEGMRDKNESNLILVSLLWLYPISYFSHFFFVIKPS